MSIAYSNCLSLPGSIVLHPFRNYRYQCKNKCNVSSNYIMVKQRTNLACFFQGNFLITMSVNWKHKLNYYKLDLLLPFHQLIYYHRSRNNMPNNSNTGNHCEKYCYIHFSLQSNQLHGSKFRFHMTYFIFNESSFTFCHTVK